MSPIGTLLLLLHGLLLLLHGLMKGDFLYVFPFCLVHTKYTATVIGVFSLSLSLSATSLLRFRESLRCAEVIDYLMFSVSQHSDIPLGLWLFCV